MTEWVQWGIGIGVMVLGVALADQRYEIRRLRDWRHKVGDDPSDAVSKLYDILERRVTKLEGKVFNGHRTH